MKTRLLAMALSLLLLFACMPKEIPPPLPPPKPAKVAVVLGAGASKGFAHIGVLKVLESQKIQINLIVGTSAGSVVGSLYASGIDAFQLQTIAIALLKDDVVDWTLPDNGFIRGEKLENFINKAVRQTPLERLKIPFRAVATNLQTGEEIVFATGNTGRAVRASCSIPGIFQPVRIGDKAYVDGGVVSPVAVDAARKAGADVVIAVDISAGVAGAVPQGILDTILQSIDIMYAKIAAAQLKNADVVIRPQVSQIGSGDFDKRNEAIFEGEKAAAQALPQIQLILGKLRQEGRLP
ncbi:MAG: patatin-like phospholipase family protein [Proteobacteria bacterium]|nr:patatin-like phospholipase family protein [Pseudomonadota bacterium]MBU2026919.1 patatin-like phospholipase family protein [Pseudomonadota bacterium]MBU2234425.1 patatin-like phospholipase family protein [Pseudomonadota bacterium]MBU3932505.1 patatin-like phospholipase family protein [Pseudomonadota bacterium]MBU4121196.1 patatin-like phospholipase family protein [Pseudomonadota bacterium]